MLAVTGVYRSPNLPATLAMIFGTNPSSYHLFDKLFMYKADDPIHANSASESPK
jgi:hypothetical protein